MNGGKNQIPTTTSKRIWRIPNQPDFLNIPPPSDGKLEPYQIKAWKK